MPPSTVCKPEWEELQSSPFFCNPCFPAFLNVTAQPTASKNRTEMFRLFKGNGAFLCRKKRIETADLGSPKAKTKPISVLYSFSGDICSHLFWNTMPKSIYQKQNFKYFSSANLWKKQNPPTVSSVSHENLKLWQNIFSPDNADFEKPEPFPRLIPYWRIPTEFLFFSVFSLSVSFRITGKFLSCAFFQKFFCLPSIFFSPKTGALQNSVFRCIPQKYRLFSPFRFLFFSLSFFCHPAQKDFYCTAVFVWKYIFPPKPLLRFCFITKRTGSEVCFSQGRGSVPAGSLLFLSSSRTEQIRSFPSGSKKAPLRIPSEIIFWRWEHPQCFRDKKERWPFPLSVL